MFTTTLTHLPNNLPFEVLPHLTEVWQFKYDNTEDWSLILDNLGACFEYGRTPDKQLAFGSEGDGELEMLELHWMMLGKITHMNHSVV